MVLQDLGKGVSVDKNNLTYFKVILQDGSRKQRSAGGYMIDVPVVIRVKENGKIDNPNEWPVTDEQLDLIKRWSGKGPRVLRADERIRKANNESIPAAIEYPDIDDMVEAFEKDAERQSAILETDVFKKAVAEEVKKILSSGNGSIANTFVEEESLDPDGEEGDDDLLALQKELEDEPDIDANIGRNASAGVGTLGISAGGGKPKAGAGPKKRINGAAKTGSKKSGK